MSMDQPQSRAETILVEAPDDVSIEEVLVRNGPIKRGQQLLRLKSFHVERMQIHIALFKEHIDIMERPFQDGRIDQEIAILKQRPDVLNEIVNKLAVKAKSLHD